jgi:3-deoxy-D-manno-octulosonate 8-phosphate phosphatase (KDO 8-P phosphatase)
MENFKTRLNSIKAFIFDVDGVLTDGSVTLMPDGEQVRIMNIKDGYALQLAIKRGYKIAIISGGRSEMVRKRLNGLGITDIFLGASDKADPFNEFISTYSLDPAEILYMGDDMPDLDVMKRVGIPTCPQDSAPEIKSISLYISHINGGKGAVRDVIEQVMKAQRKWADKDGFVW